MTSTQTKRAGSKPASKPAKSKPASKSKPAAKPAKTADAAPTLAQRLKMTPAKLRKLNLRKVVVVNADGKTKRTVLRPIEAVAHGRGGTTRTPKFAPAADAASAMVCTDPDGQPNGRARVGTKQVERVSKSLGRRKPADVVHKIIGGKSAAVSAKLAGDYANGRIGSSDLPDGARERITAASTAVGTDNHKITGKALVAVVLALATTKPAK